MPAGEKAGQPVTFRAGPNLPRKAKSCMSTQADRRIIPIQEQPLRGARVLIAEDDALLAFDMENLLRNAGAEVVGPAATLAETLTLASSPYLSCAVLDVDLRRDTVFPAAQVLKERRVKIVFYTSSGEWEKLGQNWPEAQVLTKPSSVKRLLQAVCEACRGGSSQSAAAAEKLKVLS